MNRYYNQNLVKRNAEKIKNLNNETRMKVIIDLEIAYKSAKMDVERINEYTAPEEQRRRYDCLNYFIDLFDTLGVQHE